VFPDPMAAGAKIVSDQDKDIRRLAKQYREAVKWA